MLSKIIATGPGRLALAFTLLLCAASPASLATALGLEQAQQIAVARSRQLAGIGAAVSASRDMAVAVRQLPDPVIKFGVITCPWRGRTASPFKTIS